MYLVIFAGRNAGGWIGEAEGNVFHVDLLGIIYGGTGGGTGSEKID